MKTNGFKSIAAAVIAAFTFTFAPSAWAGNVGYWGWCITDSNGEGVGEDIAVYFMNASTLTPAAADAALAAGTFDTNLAADDERTYLDEDGSTIFDGSLAWLVSKELKGSQTFYMVVISGDKYIISKSVTATVSSSGSGDFDFGDFSDEDGNSLYTWKEIGAGGGGAAGEEEEDQEPESLVVTVSVPLNPGYNIVAPLFDAKHETRDLQDVKLDGTEGWGDEYICCFDNNGLSADQTYSWYCPDSSGLDDFCWVDDNIWDLARGVSYLPGQGFEMYADGEGLSVEVEVDIAKPLESCSLSLQPGYNFVGNPYCAPISLKNFRPAGGSGWATEFVYFLDAEGLPIQDKFFTWQNEVMNNFESWVDGAGGISPDDMLIQPGKGFILYVDGTELTLEIAPPTREELEKALNASSN